jgi:hypothetical protein
MVETPNITYNNPQCKDRAERAKPVAYPRKPSDKGLLLNAIELSYGEEF